jgi:N-acetylmuramoyl-L-alanine amidase
MKSLEALLKFILSVLNKAGYKNKEVKVTIMLKFPFFSSVKPKLIDLKWLKNKGDKEINFILIHHSTTTDNPKTFDWDAIDRYHRSYRWNWEIQVGPVPKPDDVKDPDLYEYNDNWYKRADVEAYYQRASSLVGYPIPFGKSIQQSIHGNCLETPWMMIGYNLGIEEGTEGLVLKYGRSLVIPGAHCPQMNMNRQSIGICVIGNYDRAPLDEERYKMLVTLCQDIKLVYPKAKIMGHHEVEGVLKTCPGKKLPMDALRSAVDSSGA